MQAREYTRMMRAERGIRAPRPALTTGTMLEASHVMAEPDRTTSATAVEEEWRDALGGEFRVSNLGRVRLVRGNNRTKSGELVGFDMTAGYRAVSLRGRFVYVHHLVASAFIGPMPPGMCVNHIDGDKQNNRPENLEYVTHAENMRHAGRTGLMTRGEARPTSKLTEPEVRSIREAVASGEKVARIAARYPHVRYMTVLDIARRKTWRHIP